MTVRPSRISGRRFLAFTDDDGNHDYEDRDDFIAVESDGEEVNIHFSPGTEDVATMTLSTEEAWTVLRELAREIADAERDE